MTDDRDAAMEATVEMLRDAGMVEEYVGDDGKPWLRLTDKGEQRGRAGDGE